LLKGGEQPLAISKERKNEALAQYSEWANRSRALIITEYRGLTMKQIDDLRSRLREAGGEFHIVKNTLGKMAFEREGMPLPAGLLEGSTAVGFAFNDAPAVAKADRFARTAEALKIKGDLDNARSARMTLKPWRTCPRCRLCALNCWVCSWLLLTSSPAPSPNRLARWLLCSRL
jgi:hypothetical protein